MSRYFGTDGFRGEANINLTADHAYKVGRFLGWYYTEKRARAAEEGRPMKEGPARIVIGKDTRRSSYMFEYSLVAGLVASGADAYMLHVTTTPSVAYIARVDDFDCGIMISASHNPYYDNGIKLINDQGEKMDEETIELVEDYLDWQAGSFRSKVAGAALRPEGQNRLHRGLRLGPEPVHRLPHLFGYVLLPRGEGGPGLRQRLQLEHC